jgi:hypothetical protein
MGYTTPHSTPNSDNMSLSTKVVTRLLPSTRSVGSGEQNRVLNIQGIDREMVEVMFTANWDKMNNNSSVKDDIKHLTREQIDGAKQEKKGVKLLLHGNSLNKFRDIKKNDKFASMLQLL